VVPFCGVALGGAEWYGGVSEAVSAAVSGPDWGAPNLFGDCGKVNLGLSVRGVSLVLHSSAFGRLTPSYT
jgi:hypothetical protein